MELIHVSIVTPIVKGVTYATPARKHMIYASSEVTISDDADFTVSDTLVGANTIGAKNSAPFLQMGAGGYLICKPT